MPDLAEYPIVVLENDAPERVGKVGLFDLYMPVGRTGLVFIAAVPGILYPSGPQFALDVQRAACLRAATTLVQMGLVAGDSFAFVREALSLGPQEAADLVGVDVSIVLTWESNSVPVPIHAWTLLAARACVLDGKAMPLDHALCANWRPREIRVFPNVPMTGSPQSGQLPMQTQQVFPNNFPGAECYPPPCC